MEFFWEEVEKGWGKLLEKLGGEEGGKVEEEEEKGGGVGGNVIGWGEVGEVWKGIVVGFKGEENIGGLGGVFNWGILVGDNILGVL